MMKYVIIRVCFFRMNLFARIVKMTTSSNLTISSNLMMKTCCNKQTNNNLQHMMMTLIHTVNYQERAALRMTIYRKCSMCAYKINPQTGKRNNKRTVNYCGKCKKYVCENCFQDFHTKSNI